MGTEVDADGPALTRGAKQLAQWMKDERRTQQWVADQVTTHQTNVSAWLKGRPIPLDKAVAVHRLTGIAIEEWAAPAAESGTDVTAGHVSSRTG